MPQPFFDSQDIDNALYDLVEGKNKEVKLVLNKKERLELTFKIIDDALHIVLGSLKKIKLSYLSDDNHEQFENRMIKKLQGMGFVLNEKTFEMTYKYDLKLFRETIFLKDLLTKIIYDGAIYYEIHKPFLIIST